MTPFHRGSDALGNLRDAASQLKRWRPAGQSKLRVAREHIEREAAAERSWPEGRSAGGGLADLSEESSRSGEKAGGGPVLFDRDSGSGAHAGSGTFGSFPAPRPPRNPDTRKKLPDSPPRRLERLFPGSRRLVRKLDRLAFAAKPWLFEARRAFRKHRWKLLFIFVAASLAGVALLVW